MTTTAAREALTAAVTRRTELVRIAEALPAGRKRAAAWKAVEQADADVRFATADVERAVRASMPGAAERDIMAATYGVAA